MVEVSEPFARFVKHLSLNGTLARLNEGCEVPAGRHQVVVQVDAMLPGSRLWGHIGWDVEVGPSQHVVIRVPPWGVGSPWQKL